MVKTLYFSKNGLYVLEQRLLPGTTTYVRCATHKDVYRAIKDMSVRGAPAIGVAAAYGVALAAGEKHFRTAAQAKVFLLSAISFLSSSRPTAVNLFWALKRMGTVLEKEYASPVLLQKALLKEAHAVYAEDIRINRAMGEYGARLIKKGSGILTHCNAGALATAGYGTALGVIRSAHRQGKVKRVYVDETRPYLQGARLTAWEMAQEKIPHVLITDNMAGHFMKTGVIDAVIVGADRVAANGDTANKIGTYSLAVLAKYHRIPLFVAAPTSTIDRDTPTGSHIVIEERSTEEVVYIGKKCIAPAGTKALHPAFDVTPAKLISAIITEHGIVRPVNARTIAAVKLQKR